MVAGDKNWKGYYRNYVVVFHVEVSITALLLFETSGNLADSRSDVVSTGNSNQPLSPSFPETLADHATLRLGFGGCGGQVVQMYHLRPNCQLVIYK